LKITISMALTTWIWNASHGINSMTWTKFHNMDDNTFIDKNDLDPYVFFSLCESNMCTFFLLQTSFLLYEVYFVMILLSKRFQWELLHLWLIISTKYCWKNEELSIAWIWIYQMLSLDNKYVKSPYVFLNAMW
jgi:hypothetical protein